MDITLTDGGIETRIIYEFKRPIGDFEAYKLLEARGPRSPAHLPALCSGSSSIRFADPAWHPHVARQP